MGDLNRAFVALLKQAMSVTVRPKEGRGDRPGGYEVVVLHPDGLTKKVTEFASKTDAVHFAAQYAQTHNLKVHPTARRHHAEIHAPYRIKERGDQYVVVNDLGETKGTHDTYDAARQHQKALYANVPGASEMAKEKKQQREKAASYLDLAFARIAKDDDEDEDKGDNPFADSDDTEDDTEDGEASEETSYNLPEGFPDDACGEPSGDSFCVKVQGHESKHTFKARGWIEQKLEGGGESKKTANRYPEFVVYKRGEDVRSIKMYLRGLDVNYVIDDGDGQFEVSVHANDLAEAKRRLTAKTAANPYTPPGNPYVSPPSTPGTPDELLDGPNNPQPYTLDMDIPMTTRPRQVPGDGDETEQPPGTVARRNMIPIICLGCRRRFAVASIRPHAKCVCGSTDLDLDETVQHQYLISWALKETGETGQSLVTASSELDALRWLHLNIAGIQPQSIWKMTRLGMEGDPPFIHTPETWNNPFVQVSQWDDQFAVPFEEDGDGSKEAVRKQAWEALTADYSGACGDRDHASCRMEHLDPRKCLCTNSFHGVADVPPRYASDPYYDRSGACGDGDHASCQMEHYSSFDGICLCPDKSHTGRSGFWGSRRTAAVERWMVVDERNGSVYWSDQDHRPFTEATATEFARIRNEALVEPGAWVVYRATPRVARLLKHADDIRLHFKTCETCGANNWTGATECEYCGAEFPKTAKVGYSRDQWRELTLTFFHLTGEHLSASSLSENMARKVLDRTGSVAEAAKAAAHSIGKSVSLMDAMQAHDEALRRSAKRQEMVRGIMASNPGMNQAAAMRLADKTLKRFPQMIKSAAVLYEGYPGWEVIDHTQIKVGDIVGSSSYAGQPPGNQAEVLRAGEEGTEGVGPLSGLPVTRYWARSLADGREGYLSFGPGGVTLRKLTSKTAANVADGIRLLGRG